MNGRIYDANGAHFEQADPFVQDAGNLQSYNRYAYLMNNPLASTDPTGYWGARQQGYVRQAAAIAIAIWGGYEAYEALGGAAFGSTGVTAAQEEAAVTWAATTGAASGFVSSDGSMNAAVLGAFDATANVAIGGIGNVYAKVGAHALEGGVMSTLQGGRFGHGFVSAGLSAVINPAIAEHVRGYVAGGIAATISGGTISAVTGGKFANGAYTSAFEYAFNAALHAEQERQLSKDENEAVYKASNEYWQRVSSSDATSMHAEYPELYEWDNQFGYEQSARNGKDIIRNAIGPLMTNTAVRFVLQSQAEIFDEALKDTTVGFGLSRVSEAAEKGWDIYSKSTSVWGEIKSFFGIGLPPVAIGCSVSYGDCRYFIGK
jgi:hypothetical protein